MSREDRLADVLVSFEGGKIWIFVLEADMKSHFSHNLLHLTQSRAVSVVFYMGVKTLEGGILDLKYLAFQFGWLCSPTPVSWFVYYILER